MERGPHPRVLEHDLLSGTNCHWTYFQIATGMPMMVSAIRSTRMELRI